ncbi:CRISPR-associated protein, partial [Synechocystis salina LEGE 06155]|nr:CRISPR-associated protein [Synechocystis salina LEGE 06155]
LTPGLAQIDVHKSVYGIYPTEWQTLLRGCVSERPILWGGISVYQKRDSLAKEVAYIPQRAFVPAGTVYCFRDDQTLPQNMNQLLPHGQESWLETFQTLGFGTLLWGY